jgi:hypothetical protein
MQPFSHSLGNVAVHLSPGWSGRGLRSCTALLLCLLSDPDSSSVASESACLAGRRPPKVKSLRRLRMCFDPAFQSIPTTMGTSRREETSLWRIWMGMLSTEREMSNIPRGNSNGTRLQGNSLCQLKTTTSSERFLSLLWPMLAFAIAQTTGDSQSENAMGTRCNELSVLNWSIIEEGRVNSGRRMWRRPRAGRRM